MKPFKIKSLPKKGYQKGSRVITTSMDPEDADWVRKCAKENGLTVSALVRQILEHAIVHLKKSRQILEHTIENLKE